MHIKKFMYINGYISIYIYIYTYMYICISHLQRGTNVDVKTIHIIKYIGNHG